jgi:lysophospholipase L1-like esterase
MRHWIARAMLVVFTVTPAFAAPEPASPPAADPRLKSPPAKLNLQDGDTVVFLGDSITHQCLYTQFLEDFFYTRMPGVHLRFHNAGVGGDRAQDALDRFDMDVAAYKPKYVTILLGMNDGGYKQWDARTFDAYQKGMLELLDKISGIGATAIVMGPTMYDREALLLEPKTGPVFDNDTGKYYNGVLGYYGTFMRDQAAERGLTYVDMFAALNDLTAQQRIHDPSFTMIPGAVHPNANGHTVMAAAFLDAVHTPAAVCNTQATLTPKGWKVTVGPGGNATDVEGDADHLSFTAQDPALPWILPPDAAVGYKLSIAGHHHSTEPFRVVGLSPGKYELKIDGQPVGVFAAPLLAEKIELQNFDKCPQYQQALAVANLDKEKNDKVVHPMRDLYLHLKIKRHEKGATPESVQAYIDQIKPKLADLDKQQADYDQKIYEAAQPKPLKFELTKVTPAGSSGSEKGQ